MAQLTLCMIVRDEEDMLADCLSSVRRAVDRMVIVDTGSTDGTRDVIRRFGAELVEYDWNDDFAAARNAGLARVDSGFVLVLDADERLTSRGARLLRAVARRDRIDLGMLPLHEAASLDARPEAVVSGRARRGEPMLLPRLMRRTRDLRYEGIVHESIAEWASQDRRVEEINAPIIHYGAVAELREKRGKAERNRRLLELRCAQNPGDPIARAHLAAEIRRAGDWNQALEAARQAWSSWQAAERQGQHHDSVLPASVLAHLAIHFDELGEAGGVLAEALEKEDHPNLHLLAGIVEEQRALTLGSGREALTVAARCYERSLALEGRTFASEVMAGATSWQSATRLGTVLLQSGEPVRAREAFERALRSRADFSEASLGVAEADLEKGDAKAALERLEPLLSATDAGPDGWLLLARAAWALGSTADAQLLFERARAARDVGPFVAPHRDRLMASLESELGRLATPANDENAEVCVFAWPCYDGDEDLDVLMSDFGKLLADQSGLVLCLRHDASIDGDVSSTEALLERAFSEQLGGDCDLPVILVDQTLESDDAVSKLAGPGDIAIELPNTHGVRQRFIEALGVQRVKTPETLQHALVNARNHEGNGPAQIDTHPTAWVEADVAGHSVRLSYSDAPGLRPFVESVLSGEDYPIVFPGLFEATTIVDIGAHVGAATLYLKSHYPSAEIFAFEPSELSHAHLCDNTRDLPGIHTRRAALSDHDGQARLYQGSDSSMQNSIKSNEENGSDHENVDLFDAGAVFEKLDREIFSIVKLDTEGCELEILGSISRFLPSIEVVYLEYHSEADRLAIDLMLCPDFVLYASRANEPHRGTISYVRADVFERCSARQDNRHVFPKV